MKFIKMKNNSLFTLLAFLAFGLFVTSCKDDFSEEDLLRFQVQLGSEQDSLKAVKALAALDSAGAFFDFTISLNNDDSFVAGASVTLYGQAAGAVTQTTDASGSTTFTSVTSGGTIVTISGAGYADAVLNVDFPNLANGTNYIITNDGVYVPLKASTSVVIPIFAADGTTGSVGTISGRVEIETDLTDTDFEIPQDIQIVGVVDVDDANQDSQGGVSISRYAFDNDERTGFGVAVVDNTTGLYTMTVPATADGLNIQLELPNIEATQRLAVGFVDGIPLARPEFMDVLANFGPSFGTSNIPTIRGGIALFPAPPAPGAGFSLSTFARVPDAINNFDLDSRFDALTRPEDEGDIILQLTSFGAGYTASPDVAITDATGTNGRVEAHVEFAIGGVTVTTAGVGYTANENVTMDIFAERRITTGTSPNLVITTQDQLIGSVVVIADATGNLTQTEVNTAVAAEIAANTFGFDADDPIYTTTAGIVRQSDNDVDDSDEMETLRVDFTSGTPSTAPAGTATVSVGRLLRVGLFEAGQDYTNPTFAFSGGGGTTQAALSVLEYASQWTFALDNTSSAGYDNLPNDIYFEYQIAGLTPTVSNTDGGTNDVEEFINGVSGGSFDFISDQILMVNGSGGIAYTDQAATYQTTFVSVQAPAIKVIERTTTPAQARVNINSEGEVTSLSNFTNGDGYAAEFEVTIEPSIVGAPGSGAMADLINGTFSTDEYQWFGGVNIITGGSGFIEDLNQQNDINGAESFQFITGSSSIDVRTGDVISVNINYGTGARQVDVTGDWFDTDN